MKRKEQRIHIYLRIHSCKLYEIFFSLSHTLTLFLLPLCCLNLKFCCFYSFGILLPECLPAICSTHARKCAHRSIWWVKRTKKNKYIRFNKIKKFSIIILHLIFLCACPGSSAFNKKKFEAKKKKFKFKWKLFNWNESLTFFFISLCTHGSST